MAQVIVVGLGVSGLACALEVQERQVEFSAFEQEAVAGGLARSERRDGFTFDYGPHIILQTPGLFDRLDLELDDCVCESTIFPNLTEVMNIPAPIQHHLDRLPLAERGKIFIDIVRRNLGRYPARPATFQQHILANSGKTLFELFFRDYELKRLRFPLEDIDASMPNRIQPPSLAYLFGLGAANRQAACGGNDTRFKYPSAGGIDALPRAMLALLPQQRIHLRHSLSEIDPVRKRVTFANGRSEFFDRLVVSLPLPEILCRLKDPPKMVLAAAEQLIYSSLYVLNAGVDGPSPHPWAIARIPKQNVCFYRVCVPSNYSKASVPEGLSSLTIEVAHHEQRHPLSEMRVRRLIYDDLTRLGILASPKQVVVEWLHNIRYGHVVYNTQTRQALALIFAYLNGQGVYCCGKYGEWRDMLMPHAIQSGIEAAHKAMSR